MQEIKDTGIKYIDVFTGNYLEKTIASILENNAQVPHKHPMNIIKLTRRTPLS